MNAKTDPTFWYLNTNERGQPNDKSIDLWFERGLGFTCDSKYGPPLAKLCSGDIVFMYRSGLGIIGIGTVLESWDGRAHQGKARILEYASDFDEFRIRINWFDDLRSAPLNGNHAIGNTPAQFLESIVDPSFRARAEKLVAGRTKPDANPDRVYPEGGRKTGQTIRRVQRNSQLAKNKIASVPFKDRECECCGDQTQERYPDEVVVYEVHHRVPFKDDDKPRATTLKDVAIVCPNCHSAITKLDVTTETLRKKLR